MTSKRWWTTGIPYIDLLYLPYTLMTISYVIIGGLVAENPRFDMLFLVIIGEFIAVGIVSHAIDESKGHPLNTGISNQHLKWIAIGGLTIDFLIALWLTIFYHWTIMIIFIAVAFLLVAYNAEAFDGAFHRDMFFTLGFATIPLFGGYYVATLQVPSLADILFFAGMSATASIETVVNHFVKSHSEDYHKAYDKDFAYLQRAVWATVWITYLIALSLIVKHIEVLI